MILKYLIYEYKIDVKNAVKNIIIMKILSNPKINEIMFILFLDFKLTSTKIGMIGKIQGDNIEIAPVKNEIIGKISI